MTDHKRHHHHDEEVDSSVGGGVESPKGVEPDEAAADAWSAQSEDTSD